MKNKWTMNDLKALEATGRVHIPELKTLCKPKEKNSANRKKNIPVVQTVIEGIGIQPEPAVEKKRSREESLLQSYCFTQFRKFWPEYVLNFYAIPNGGARDIVTASILKKEGVVSGVLDSFLAVAVAPWSGLFVEFKTKTGRLSPNQLLFIEAVRKHYKCIVIRDVETFLVEVDRYLGTNRIVSWKKS